MKADAKRKPARSYRLSPRWSVFTLDTQPRVRDPNGVPRFNRSRRSPKNRKNPRGVPGIVFSFFFFFFWAREKTKSKVVKRNEIRGRDRIYRLAIFEKVEKFFKRMETRYATMPIRYRTRDGRYPRYYVRLIVFFFLFSHASIIATRAIIPVLFFTFFSFGRERKQETN